MAFKGRTIPLIWKKPYSTQWVADTPLASISIHKSDNRFAVYMSWMEAESDGEFRKRNLPLTDYEKLADAKAHAQNQFDELFVPIAKKMRRHNYRASKTARVRRPFCF